VVCIACGTSVLRSEAREYDKEGDRWDRHGKEFEYLCRACHADLCHQPREGLESLVTAIEADDLSRGEFLRRYVAEVNRRRERAGGSDS